MKKLLVLLLSACMLLCVGIGLTACGRADAWVIVKTGLDASGKEQSNSTYRQEGEPMIEIETPTKAGYRFVGWDKEIPETVPAGEFIITAIWELEETPESAFVFSNNKITGLTSSGRDLLGLKIPETIGGSLVKEIGNQVFTNEDYIDVVLPNSITKIGDYAFMSANICNSITLPNQLKSIGRDAFDSCIFNQITLPDSLTSIGAFAFESCNNLTTINIPANVSSIGSAAFGRCNKLTSITVTEGSKYYKSIDGNLYNASATKLIQYAVGKTETEYTAPDTVEDIADWAFYGSRNLKKVSFSQLTNCPSYAFNDATALENITITYDKYTNYSSDEGILYRVDDNSRLVLVYYPVAKKGPVTVKSGVKEIEDYAFFCCKDLGIVNLPSSIDTIGKGAFERCENLSGITFDGTMADFQNITKGNGWNSSVPATYVTCSDGNYTIKTA